MQFDSCLPGVLTSYDGKKGNVRPLIDIRMVDGSYIPFPEVKDVPIISPATAFAGIKLPIKVGDKVVLHIADKDIQTLLFDTSTAGLDDPGNAIPPSNRSHQITDAIAYTGFQSLEDMIPSDNDVWIFNNRGTDPYNHIRLKANGDIELKTLKATGTFENGGDIELKNSTCSVKMTELGNISINNEIASTVMDPLGNITTTNGTTTVSQTVAGAIVMVAPVSVTMTTPLLAVTGAVTAGGVITSAVDVFSATVSGKLHTHGGVDTGPGNTSPPN